MTHLDIYNKLSHLFKESESYHDKLKYDTDSINCLFSAILLSSCTYLIQEITKMESSEEICCNCMYYNLDAIRKSILRYSIIESESPDTAFLTYLVKEINPICMHLKNTYGEITKGCKRVENTAFKTIGRIK